MPINALRLWTAEKPKLRTAILALLEPYAFGRAGVRVQNFLDGLSSDIEERALNELTRDVLVPEEAPPEEPAAEEKPPEPKPPEPAP